jgi:pyruvate dehydrogenase E1 component beta subunit
MREWVPDQPYFIKLGEALRRRSGRDITIAAFGSAIPAVLQAADELTSDGVEGEIIDLRCLMPLDLTAVIDSVRQTGRLVVVEPGWRMYGAAAEIITGVVEAVGREMKAPPRRVTWPHAYVGTSAALEAAFYPGSSDIAAACRVVCGLTSGGEHQINL